MELLAIANASDTQAQEKYKRIFEEVQKSLGKKVYKYNINQTGANGVLEDLRNFHNFRTTWDEFPDESESSMFGTTGRQTGTSPSKSYYMSAKDFLFSNSLNYDDSLFNKPEIQPIILNEFQPDVQIYWLKTLMTAGDFLLKLGTANKDKAPGKAAQAKGSGVFGMAMNSGLFGAMKENIVGMGVNYLSRKYSLQPELLYDSAKNMGSTNATSAPITWIKEMFNSGKWLNTYELPFFNNMYLEANQYKQWKTGGANAYLGDKMAEIAKNNLPFDFPTSPTFGLTAVADTGYTDFSFDFYLINLDDYWLERNFRFLTSFYAGTQWLQMTGRIYKRIKCL